MKIDINTLIKLRKITNISINDCKKALYESNGNLNEAIIILEKNSNNFFVNKKIDNINKVGRIISSISNNNKYGFIIKIYSETDFVIKNNQFIEFCNKISNFCIDNQIKNLDFVKKYFEKDIKYLIYKFKENIYIESLNFICDKFVKNYIYREKIGLLLGYNIENIDNKDLIKELSMHIIFNNPLYISLDKIPKIDIIKEKEYQKNILIKKNIKDTEIDYLINKKINKFIVRNTLSEQKFLINNKIKIKDILLKNKIIINNFIIIKI